MGVAFEGGEAAISFVGKFGAFALKGNVIDLAVGVPPKDTLLPVHHPARIPSCLFPPSEAPGG